jgi:hypothetical protein
MTPDRQKENEKSQVEKFREAAHELEMDDSEENFDRLVKKVAKPPHQKEKGENGGK